MEGFTPWPKEFGDKYRAAGYWLDQTISEVLDECFVKHGSRVALIASGGREFTYAELGHLVTRLALHLLNLGLRPYDRLILQMPNITEVVITYLATLRAGGIPIMALFAHREAEINYFAELSQARAIAIGATWRGFDYQEMATQVRNKNPQMEMVLVAGGDPRGDNHSIDALLKDPIEQRLQASSLPRPAPDLPAVLPPFRWNHRYSQTDPQNSQ